MPKANPNWQLINLDLTSQEVVTQKSLAEFDPQDQQILGLIPRKVKFLTGHFSESFIT